MMSALKVYWANVRANWFCLWNPGCQIETRTEKRGNKAITIYVRAVRRNMIGGWRVLKTFYGPSTSE